MIEEVYNRKSKVFPSDWKMAKLGDYFNFINGFAFYTEGYSDSGYRVIDLLNILKDGTLNLTSKDKFISDEVYKNHPKQHLKNNDIIMIMTQHRSKEKLLGKCAILISDDKCILNQRVGCLRRKSEDINIAFIKYLINSYEINKLFFSQALGSSQFYVNTSTIVGLDVPYPPNKEQQKIAKILSTVDEAIEKTTAIIEETRQLKKGLMQKLFTKGIGHTRFKETKIGRIPEDWDVKRADELCVKVTDGTHDTPKKVNIGHFLVTSKNLKNGKLNFDNCYQISEKDFIEVNKRSSVDKFDVLFGMIGTIGNPVMIIEDKINFAVKNVGIFKTGGDFEMAQWLVNYFNSSIQLKYIERQKNGTTQNFLPLGFLRKIPILYPHHKERKKINNVFYQIDAKIEKEEATKTELEQLKKGLMQVLLTGKVRVKA